MAKQSPELYSVAKTFMWFAIVSIILLASLVAVVFLDYDREWKHWQKKFIALKVQKSQEELKQASQNIDQKKLGELKKELADTQGAVQVHRAEMDALNTDIADLDLKIVKTRARYQDLKQYETSAKYFFEEALLHKDLKVRDYEKKLKTLEPQADQAKQELDGLEKTREEKEARSQAFLAKEKELQKQINKVLEETRRLETSLKKITPSLAKDILNAPMVDFIAPSLQIQQVVLDNLQDDYHFARVQKVDRCTTCHLGIDQKGFEEAPQPFRTHPKLDVYLSSSSAHPLEKFGCTVCHGGNGHSLSFKDAAHMPADEAQAKDWEKKYHWRVIEKWEPRMFPSKYVEAACAKCHTDVVEVPKADKLNKGRKLAETMGCFNCHKIQGFENRWKVGPSLESVQSKVTGDWLARWLNNPKDFRPSTKMPQVFHLSNTASAEDREKNDAAIRAIAAYLQKNSSKITLDVPPVAGDPVRGEKLVKTIGCIGCHSAGGVQSNNFGPELSNLGSKTTPEWVYTWIKDPKRLSKNTRMPNLRLSDQDASDITSYLLSQKNASFDGRQAPAANPKIVDELLLNYLESTLRRSEAQAQIAQMSADEKLETLGKKSIAFQGCFGCHQIKGFEDAKPIGAELSNEGAKDIHQFDFGFIPLEKTRDAWITQKLKEPRIFDQGKLKAYHEKLRMPQFDFTDDEIGALTTFILSLTEQKIPLEMRRRLDLPESQVEKGRLLVSKFNCTGCHTLDGKTGTLRELAEDKGQAPPVLDGEGAKVHEKWLHGFLKEPVTIRPWLEVRMPTFGLSDEETSDFVRYFIAAAHEEISYKGQELPATTPEKLAAGKVLFEKFQCVKCHQVNASSMAMGSSFLAPDLTLAKKRLKPAWNEQWLNDPQKLQPDTMMPTFFPDGETPLPDVLNGDTQQQIQAIRDYLYTYETEIPVAKSDSKT